MKISLRCAFLLLAAFFAFRDKASANLRLDIAMEGPWILYVQPNFKTAAGASTVLIAVAPQVSGHYPPVFSAGDGGNYGVGVNCVAFDHVCIPHPTSATSLTHDGYADPSPVPLSQPSWNWSQFAQSAYVLILPMPDSVSADGKDSLTFQKVLPTGSSPNPPSTSPANYAIGVQLHYANGPDKLGLYSCSNPQDASSCTTSVFGSDEDNSGTLRLTIRSDEGPANPDKCKYHLHGAYHAMLGLVDTALTYNAAKAYVDLPKYDSACTPGDPQQDPFLSAQPAARMLHSDYPFIAKDVPATLDTLVVYLKSLKLQGNSTEQLVQSRLEQQADHLRGKFAKSSDLSELTVNLKASEDRIGRLLEQLAKNSEAASDKNGHEAHESDLALRLEVALLRLQALEREATVATLSIFTGKDCRSAIVLVQ
jgi:hypothetical protein